MNHRLPGNLLESRRFVLIAACITGNILGTILMIVLSERTLSLRPALNQMAAYMQFRSAELAMGQYLQYLLENRGMLFVMILVCINSKVEKWFLVLLGMLTGVFLAVTCMFSVMIWSVGGILVMAGATLPHMLFYGASVYMLLRNRDDMQPIKNAEWAGQLQSLRMWLMVISLWIMGMLCEWQLCPGIIGWIFEFLNM